MELLKFTTNDYANIIKDSIHDDWIMNSIRWKNYPNFNIVLNRKKYDLNVLDGHVEYIRDLFEKRVDFLSEFWCAPDDFCKITFANPESSIEKNYDRVLYCKKNDSLTLDKLPYGIFDDLVADSVEWYSENGISIKDIDVITHDMIFTEKKFPQNNIYSNDKHVNKILYILIFVVFMCIIGLFLIKKIIIPTKGTKK